jgi:hypothetical protein
MRNSIDGKIREFRNRMMTLLVLRRMMSAVTVYLFAWGTAALVLRFSLSVSMEKLLWAGAGILLLCPPVLWMQWKNMPDSGAVCALLDLYNRMGGLLMAGQQADVSLWLPSDMSLRSPVPVWRGRREWSLLAASLIFCTACFWAMQQITPVSGPDTLEIGHSLDRIREKIEILEKAQILEKTEADKMKSELESLKEKTDATDPSGTWESLDHLEQSLNAEAKEGTVKMAGQMQELRQMAYLTEALKDSTDLKPEVRAEVMKELAKMLREAGNEINANGFSAEEMRKALEKGVVSEEQLAELEQELKEMEKQASADLRQMEKSGMAKTGEAQGEGSLSEADLADFLKEKGPQMSSAEVLDAMPGKGGLQRGRGDAALTWKERSDEAGTKFSEKPLNPSELKNLRRNMQMGQSLSAPETGKFHAPKNLGQGGPGAGEGTAVIHQLLPRHKGPVERYFDRSGTSQGEERLIFDALGTDRG